MGTQLKTSTGCGKCFWKEFGKTSCMHYTSDKRGCNRGVRSSEGWFGSEWNAAAVARNVEALQGSCNLADKSPPQSPLP